MKYRPEDPRNFNNDRFILSKVRVSKLRWSEYESLCSFCNCNALLLFMSISGSCCSCVVLHMGWNRFSQGERIAQFMPGWLYPGGAPNPRKPPHTVPITHLRTQRAQTLLRVYWFIWSVYISETTICGCRHWIAGAGSWCGLWNGLHWEISWQIQVIPCPHAIHKTPMGKKRCFCSFTWKYQLSCLNYWHSVASYFFCSALN